MSETEVDVVVLGTGAAGLVAALAAHDAGAKVGLFEKAFAVGGTTALSGAVAWMPVNKFAAAEGVNDSRDQAIEYLGSLSHGMIRPEMTEALVDTAPEVIDWLESSTPVRWRLCKGYPDYHPEHPGGKTGGGRSIEPESFSYETLGGWADRVIGKHYPRMLAEGPLGGFLGQFPEEELQRRAQERIESGGRSLVGSLLKACLDRGIEPQLDHRGKRLIKEGDRICGVTFTRGDGVELSVRARKGVILATGGFEWDADLSRSFLRGPLNFPPTVPTNTGDGLRMAMAVGAMLGNMREAWWCPVALKPGETQYGEQAVSLINRERTLPRSILINRKGKRFANEAANYNALGAAFHQFDPTEFQYQNLPCWMIFDAEYLRLYTAFGSPPGSAPPASAAQAPTLAELARKVGVPADALEATVERWNGFAAQLRDDDFHRGQSAYDGWPGDHNHYPGPAATIGPIDNPPYYAVELQSSALGTKGGPLTDVNGAVYDTDGAIIPGLYAVGNAMSAATGMVYAGAGGTIGPAIIFGFRAGQDAAAQSARQEN